jgi:hypothetical protein
VFLPADVAQGRLAASMLSLRDMADDAFARSRDPGLSLEQTLTPGATGLSEGRQTDPRQRAQRGSGPGG